MTSTALLIDTSEWKIHPHHSKHHPNLENMSSPRIGKSTKAYRDSRKARFSDTSTASEPPPKGFSSTRGKSKRLSRLEVSKFMMINSNHRATELYAAAEEKGKEGQTFLADFVLSCTKKPLNNLIGSTWEVREARATLEREETSGIQVLKSITGCLSLTLVFMWDSSLREGLIAVFLKFSASIKNFFNFCRKTWR